MHLGLQGGPTLQAVVTRLKSSTSMRNRPRQRRGYCMTRPRVGDRLVLYSSTGRRRLMTTVIERALSTDSENVFYLQTANSLYRVELSELPDIGGSDDEQSVSDAELDQSISREFN